MYASATVDIAALIGVSVLTLVTWETLAAGGPAKGYVGLGEAAI